MTEHPLGDLSARLDGALPAERAAAVDAHVDGCAACAARLGELRQVSRLLAVMPAPLPSRSLVPRLARGPSWLAPLRTLSAITSGAFVFLFIASTMLSMQPPAETSRTRPEGRALFATPGFFGPAGPSGAAGAAGAAAPTTSTNAAAAAPAPKAADAATASRSAAPPSPDLVFQSVDRGPAPSGPSSLVWLALAFLFGGAALALQRRLRKG